MRMRIQYFELVPISPKPEGTASAVHSNIDLDLNKYVFSKSKEVGKDQESIQSSTTSDPKLHMGNL